MKGKSSEETKEAFRDFQGNAPFIHLYSDNAPELKAAASKLNWTHSFSVPGRPQTNAVAERCVRHCLEGCRTLLDQAGLPPSLWTKAVQYWCMMINTQPKEGVTPYEAKNPGLRSWDAMRIPFGCLVEFKPCLLYTSPSPRDRTRSRMPSSA